MIQAPSGPQYQEEIPRCQPHVIVMDLAMPGMDGFEVARQLKADPATEPIPILFMTGLTDTGHVVAAFSAGSADYVTKPIRSATAVAMRRLQQPGYRRSSTSR